jgi:cytochrome c
MRPQYLLASTLTLVALVACGGSAPPPESPEGEAAPGEQKPPPVIPTTFPQQVKRGEELYVAQCAGCHGDSGEGKPDGGPPVVGLKEGALPLDPPPDAKGRTTQFKTVQDIAEFVVSAMPPNAPGSLELSDYYSILAFDLKANGIDLGNQLLDKELAETLEVPR